MSDHDILYTGLFVDDIKLLLDMFPPIHEIKYAHHSTIQFQPDSLDGIEVGKKNKIKIIGRVFDEKGDVLLVGNIKSKNKFPHITISCRKDTQPVYSNELLEKANNEGRIQYFCDILEIDSTEGYSDGSKVCISVS